MKKQSILFCVVYLAGMGVAAFLEDFGGGDYTSLARREMSGRLISLSDLQRRYVGDDSDDWAGLYRRDLLVPRAPSGRGSPTRAGPPTGSWQVPPLRKSPDEHIRPGSTPLSNP